MEDFSDLDTISGGNAFYTQQDPTSYSYPELQAAATPSRASTTDAGSSIYDPRSWTEHIANPIDAWLNQSVPNASPDTTTGHSPYLNPLVQDPLLSYGALTGSANNLDPRLLEQPSQRVQNAWLELGASINPVAPTAPMALPTARVESTAIKAEPGTRDPRLLQRKPQSAQE